jgi:hypothetical protein
VKSSEEMHDFDQSSTATANIFECPDRQPNAVIQGIGTAQLEYCNFYFSSS